MRHADIFEYGQYDKLWADRRTIEAIRLLDARATAQSVKYAIVGGSAVYLHTHNPPTDGPDVDVLLYASASVAEKFIRTLGKSGKFKLNNFDPGELGPDEDRIVFGMLTYDNAIDFDVFTSLDADEPLKIPRKRKLAVEPIEPLIIEKLIRASEPDIRMVLDLLLNGTFDRDHLMDLALERKSSLVLRKAFMIAKNIKSGKYGKRQIDLAVRILARS